MRTVLVYFKISSLFIQNELNVVFVYGNSSGFKRGQIIHDL